MKLKAVLYDENTLKRSIMRIAHEIIEHNQDVTSIGLVGIKTRGLPIAERLANYIYEIEGIKVDVGILDISKFRDDLEYDSSQKLLDLQLPFQIKNKNIILIDDVICTGRTIRAALDCIVFHGRPRTVQLAVLVDRGHREFPIRADYVGKNIPTSRNEHIRVSLVETDGKDSIELFE